MGEGEYDLLTWQGGYENLILHRVNTNYHNIPEDYKVFLDPSLQRLTLSEQLLNIFVETLFIV